MSKKKTWLLYDHVFLFIKKCSEIGTNEKLNFYHTFISNPAE